MDIKRIKPIVWIIIVIVICIVLYIIVFHVPRPIMLASETIVVSGGGFIESYDEDGNLLFSFEYADGETPVRAGNGEVISVINNDGLIEILRNTKSFRIFNPQQPYDTGDFIYQIDTTTNKGSFNLIVGHEKSFWYRDGGDFFLYMIPDGQTLYERTTAALSDGNAKPSGDETCIIFRKTLQ